MELLSRHGSRRCHNQRPSIFALFTFLLGFSLTVGSVNANFLDAPILRWTFSLESEETTGSLGLGGRSLRRGNAVVASQGGDKLFVTADDASLHILNVAGASPISIAVFEPDAVSGTVTEGRSGVIVVKGATASEPYLVYAVVDTPLASLASDNGATISSRVIAVNMDGTLRWSVTVEGTIAGTPVVGSTGRLLYVSHTNSTRKGFLSVLLTDEGGSSAELTASLSPEDRDVPFGPPALQRTLEGSTNQVDPSSVGDMIIVAENRDDGFSEEGSIYLLMPSIDFEDTGGIGPESYQLILVSRSALSFSAVMAPLFVDSSLYIGGTSANLAGWSNNRDISGVLAGNEEDVPPGWSLELKTNERNSSQPLLSTPEISSDGSLLYIAGASRNLHCLQVNNGQEVWSESVESIILNQPTLFASEIGDSVVYIIESAGGRVRQFNAANGIENWQFNCVDVSGIDSCQDTVEAEFSVAGSGNVVYYGDIFGRISALEVGTFTTEAPTAAPTTTLTAAPTPALTAAQSNTPSMAGATTTKPPSEEIVIASSPTASPVDVPIVDVFDNSDNALEANDGNGNDDNNDKISMGIIIGAALAGLALVTLVAYFVTRYLLKPKKRGGKSKKSVTVTKAVKEGDVENDLEGSDEDYDSDEGVGLEDLTVTTGSDAVEIEAGPAAFKTPKTRGRRKNRKPTIRTPPTAPNLDAIEEAEDEDPGTPSGASVRAVLDEKFQETDVQTGGVGRSKQGHMELAVGLNKLRPLADEISVVSEDSSPPLPPSPPRLPTLAPQKPSKDMQEEKKDGESVEGGASGTITPKRSFAVTGDLVQTPTSPAEESTASPFLDRVKAALKYTQSPSSRSSDRSSPAAMGMSPSILSTDSSMYTNDDTKTGGSATNLSPMSTVFGGVPEQGIPEEKSLPDDEAVEFPLLSNESSEVESIRPPGAQYLTKGSTLRPKFKPSSAVDVPKVKSARTKKNLNGFSGTYLNDSSDYSTGSEEDGRLRGKGAPSDSKKTPTFKRRAKKEEPPPPKSSSMEDTWNSFLKDLADAEKQFFSPTHAQKSAVLRYNDDDDDDTVPGAPADESAAAKTGTTE